MPVSKQQIYGLSFASVCCILFGGAIAACGLIFQYHDDYNDDIVNNMDNRGYYRYYYTQYWLGAPLIVLGVVILSFLCCKARPLLYVCIALSCLTLALAIAAVVLEGPKWSGWLQLRQAALDNDEKESNGICVDDPKNLVSYRLSRYGLSCKEILYATLMQSILMACSIVSIIVSQFVVFFSIRILDRMSKRSYDVPKEQHNNVYNSHSSNVHIMSEM